jgi:hypothetical protein
MANDNEFDPGNMAKWGELSLVELAAKFPGKFTVGTVAQPATGLNKFDPSVYHYGDNVSLTKLAAMSGGGIVVGGTPTPTLGTPTLTGSLTQGIAAYGVTLSGLTDGSTGTFSISGLSVGTSGTTRSVSGTPATSGTLNFTETLDGAISSPKTTNGIATVAAGMPAYTLLYDFESTSGVTAGAGSVLTLETGSRKTLNTAGFMLQGNGGNGNIASQNTGTLTTLTNDFASDPVIVLGVDFGDFPSNTLADIRLSIGGGWTYYAPNTAVNNAGFDNSPRGKVFLAWRASDFHTGGNNAGPALSAAGAASRTIGVNITTIVNQSSASSNVVFDPLFIVDRALLKPSICLTLDDQHNSQIRNGEPLFDTYANVHPTMYIAKEFIGATAQSKVSLADVQRVYGKGWGMSVDSAPNDASLPHKQTLSAAMAYLLEGRDYVRDTFTGNTEGAKHMCWSYANTGYSAGPANKTVTSDGAAQSTITIANAWSDFVPGQRVRMQGSNTPWLGTVLEVPGAATAKLDFQLPSGSNLIRICARVPYTSLTCNGTTTVTMADTSDIFPGMTPLGYGTDGTNRVASVDSATQLTMVAPMLATVKFCEFLYTDGEFASTKIQDALLAAGFKTGRTGYVANNVNPPFTQYGADPKYMMKMRAFQGDNSATTQFLLDSLYHAITQGRDAFTYSHFIAQNDLAADITHHTTVVSTISGWVASGLCDAPTVADYWTKVAARPPIS